MVKRASFFAFCFLFYWFDGFTRGRGTGAIVIRVSILVFATGMLSAVLITLGVTRFGQHNFKLL